MLQVQRYPVGSVKFGMFIAVCAIASLFKELFTCWNNLQRQLHKSPCCIISSRSLGKTLCVDVNSKECREPVNNYVNICFRKQFFFTERNSLSSCSSQMLASLLTKWYLYFRDASEILVLFVGSILATSKKIKIIKVIYHHSDNYWRNFSSELWKGNIDLIETMRHIIAILTTNEILWHPLMECVITK